MSQIECYEPEFIRQYINQQPEFTAPFQALNQAAIDVVTLPDLSVELRLYALGITLSFAQKLPPESSETIKTLPAQIAAFAANGTLQNMYTQLPSLPLVQQRLITHLGRVSFDWESLIDCPRKTSLPLQISLLSLQDGNSEALMAKQLHEIWNAQGEKLFAAQPWGWTNYLAYRLNNDAFPHHDKLSISQCYLALVSDYFLLRALVSLWVMDGSTLENAQLESLFSVFETWRHTEEFAHEREMLHLPQLNDELVSAFSLLSR